MKKIISTLKALGFSVEYDQSKVKGKGWIRFRHEKDVQHLSALTLIIYIDDSFEDMLAQTSNILIKIGQWQKMEQLTKFI